MSNSLEVHLAGTSGPVTARQASVLAKQELKRQNANSFRFTFISAGEYIDHRGLSVHWELFFELPGSGELVMFTIEPQGDAWEEMQPPLSISITRKPWKIDESKPVLPHEFIDSPEAVTALTEQGADWVSGDTRMTLSTKFTATGKPVWHTETEDGVLEMDFAEPE